jgi:guanosine-3',5'-bis(diphosphate) 3'-pyrophosphohydrolase
MNPGRTTRRTPELATRRTSEHAHLALSELIEAIAFAAHKHRDQRRKNARASPYINHPIELARVLALEAGITDVDILRAAILHDTIEDTETTRTELEGTFGARVAGIVLEVTDDQTLHWQDRKQAQIDQARHLSYAAQQVKLADKICNLRDVAHDPPHDWDMGRRRRYFDWARSVIDGMRSPDPALMKIFEEIYARKP